MTKKKKRKWRYHPERLEQHLSATTLSMRTRNLLERKGITTLGELLDCCPLSIMTCQRRGAKRPCENLHLLDIPGFGERLLEEIFAAMKEAGFTK